MKHLALGQAPVARMHGCDRGLVLLLSATGELVYDAIGHLATPHGGRRDSPRAPQRGDATLLRGVPNRKVFVTSRLHRSTAAPAYLSSSRDSTRQSCTCSRTHPGPVAHKVDSNLGPYSLSEKNRCRLQPSPVANKPAKPVKSVRGGVRVYRDHLEHATKPVEVRWVAGVERKLGGNRGRRDQQIYRASAPRFTSGGRDLRIHAPVRSCSHGIERNRIESRFDAL